jgi:hypothetical protein
MLAALTGTLLLGCNRNAGGPSGAGGPSRGPMATTPPSVSRPASALAPGYLTPQAVKPLSLRSTAAPPPALETIDPALVGPAQADNVN